MLAKEMTRSEEFEDRVRDELLGTIAYVNAACSVLDNLAIDIYKML